MAEEQAEQKTGESQVTTPEPPKQDGIPQAVVAELRAERRQLKAVIEGLQTKVTELENRSQQTVYVDPDEPLTKAEYEQLQAAERAKEAKKAEEQHVTARTHKWQTSEVQARTELSVGKTPAGLEFDTVLQQGEAFLTPGDKLDIAHAMEPDSTHDPARLAYERCLLRNPHLQQLKAQAQTQSATKKTQESEAASGTETGNTSAQPVNADISGRNDLLTFLFS